MKLVQRFSFLLLSLSALLLSACQTLPSTLTFTPPMPTQSVSMPQSAVVFTAVRDMRVQQEVSSYVQDGQLVKLQALPTVNQLFQQVLQQDVVSKGFRATLSQPANATFTLEVNDFYAKVGQGNLRYNIDADVQVTLMVESSKGKFSKKIRASRNYQGAFSAKNPEIQTVLGEAFNEVVRAIYADHEVANAIRQLAQ